MNNKRVLEKLIRLSKEAADLLSLNPLQFTHVFLNRGEKLSKELWEAIREVEQLINPGEDNVHKESKKD